MIDTQMLVPGDLNEPAIDKIYALRHKVLPKTQLTKVEGENTRLRHYLARLHRATLCYSKSTQMLKYSVRLLMHYLKFKQVLVPA